MTIKELAEFTARTERTVRRWVSEAQKQSDTISEKMSGSYKNKKPSDFTIDEIEIILRCSSIPEMMIDGLMENARGGHTVKSGEDKIIKMVESILSQNEKALSFIEEYVGVKPTLKEIAPKQNFLSLPEPQAESYLESILNIEIEEGLRVSEALFDKRHAHLLALYGVRCYDNKFIDIATRHNAIAERAFSGQLDYAKILKSHPKRVKNAPETKRFSGLTKKMIRIDIRC